MAKISLTPDDLSRIRDPKNSETVTTAIDVLPDCIGEQCGYRAFRHDEDYVDAGVAPQPRLGPHSHITVRGENPSAGPEHIAILRPNGQQY